MFHRKLASKCNVTRHLGSIWKRARNRQPFSCTHAWSCWSARRGDVCIWSMLSGERRVFEKYFSQIWEVYLATGIDPHIFHRRWSELLKVQGGLGCIWSMQESWEGGVATFRRSGLPRSTCFGAWLRMNENTKYLIPSQFWPKVLHKLRKIRLAWQVLFHTYDTSGILTLFWDWTVCKWCNVQTLYYRV